MIIYICMTIIVSMVTAYREATMFWSMCQSRSVCCVPAPSDIVEEVGLLQYVRLTCTIHCKVCESWLMCGFVAMIQHKVKLNSLLVAQPHCLYECYLVQ